ncbi:hypothetical protein L1887_51141 [Cichorium endivia]|nr:hypothetical protein L1887_51141 [Cichorium endivia]
MAAHAAQAVDVITQQEDLRKNDPMNKITQAAKGCEAAMQAEDFSNTFQGKENNLNPVCNENVREDYSEVDAIAKNMIHAVTAITIIIALIIGFFLFKFNEKFGGKDVSLTKYIILMIFTFMLTVPFIPHKTQTGNMSLSSVIEIGVLTYMKVSSDQANTAIASIVETEKYYFSTVLLPDYFGLTGQFERILEFEIRANGVDDKKPFTFYFTDKEGDLYGRISSGKFIATLTLPIDQNCVTIAEKYGLFDCRQKQIDWYKQYIGEALTRVSAAKNNYLKSFKSASSSAFSKTFDYKMSCDNIENLDITGYNQRDMSGMYLKKVASCISHDYVYKMHKLKNITTDEYLKNNNFLKSRKISLCAHDQSGTFKYTGYNKVDRMTKVKECVDTACGAEGSPYMCSAAVATFHSLQRDKVYTWTRIPAYLIGDIDVNLTHNAETFGRRFIFDYDEASSATTVNENAQTVFTLTYPKIQGYEVTEYSYMEKLIIWAGDQYQYYMGSAMDFDVEQLNSLGNRGEDGWLGIKKLSTCISNPHRYVDGFLCGSVMQETMNNGAQNIKEGADLFMVSYGSLGKIKGTNNSTSGMVAQSKNLLGKVVNAKNASILGYFMATSAENNIYTYNPNSLEATTTNAGLFLAVAIGGDDIGKLVRGLGMLKITIGIFFYFVLPFMILSRFIITVSEFLIHLVMSLTLSPLVLLEAPLTTGSMNNTFSQKEHGIPDFLITAFLLVTFPTMVVGMLFFTGFYINNIYSVLPMDLLSLSHLITSGSYTSGSTTVSFVTDSIDVGVFMVLHIAILTLLFSTISFILRLRSWMMFRNGKFTSDDDADQTHQQLLAKVRS